jgi:hypothetical protein
MLPQDKPFIFRKAELKNARTEFFVPQIKFEFKITQCVNPYERETIPAILFCRM